MFSSQKIISALGQTQETAYDGLYQFISKNKVIPEFIANIKPEDPKLEILLDAIKKGDFDAEVFSDLDCYLYLLFLIKKNLIQFSQGMTVYSYLMARMQFTEIPLNNSDTNVKFTRPMSIVKMAENGKLIKFAESYLNYVCAKFARYGFKIDYEKLSQFVLSLNASEQWLITFKTKLHDINEKNPDHCDRIAWVLAATTAYVVKLDTADNFNSYWIPSVTLINYLLAQMSLQPMQMQFSFGTTSEETMYRIHQEDKHPVPLYAPLVKSNCLHADGWHCGPFLVWLHDVSHSFWANLLSREERQIILNEYIPDLKKIRETALLFNDGIVAENLLRFINNANSFNLSNSFLFKTTSPRFKRFLFKTISEVRILNYRSFYEGENSFSIGSLVEDRLYYLMLSWCHRSEASEKNKNLWESVLTSDHHTPDGNIAYRREKPIIKALANLAKDEKQITSGTSGEQIQWKSWQEMLSSFSGASLEVSKELWEMIDHNEVMSRELTYLISDYNVKFFHPYLPMTSEKLKDLKELVAAKTEQALTNLEPPKEPPPQRSCCSIM